MKIDSLLWSVAPFALLLAVGVPSYGATQEAPHLPDPVPIADSDIDFLDEPFPEPATEEPDLLIDGSDDDALFGDFMDLGELEEVEPVAEAVNPQPPESVMVEEEERKGWLKNVYPSFRLGGYFDDNIFIQEHDKQADFIGVVGFGLRLGLGEVTSPLDDLRTRRNVPLLYSVPPQPLGNFILADYSGNYQFFADHSELNSYDQDALVRLGWTDGKLALAFEGRFRSLSTPDIDAGGRVRRYIFNVGSNVYYELSGKTSLESNFSYTNTQYSGLIDSGEFVNENWFNYQITPKLKIAPGIGAGVLTIQGHDSQPYGRLLVRAIYEYSAKLSFNGRLGLEYRDVQEGSGFRNNPVFSIGVTYAPRDGTTMSLEGYRYAEASALLSGADYTVTGVDLKVQQRFLSRFYLTLIGGYQNLDYHLVSGDSSPSRTDNYFFGKAAVSFDITKWCNAEIFYSYQRDSSTHPGNTFDNNQVGVGFDFAF